METQEKYIAYKGFEKDLTCRKVQFEIGGTYTIQPKSNDVNWRPALCTNDGYHYCDKLMDVNNHYPIVNGDARLCEIEVLGLFTKGGDKSITTSFRIIREIFPKEIQAAYDKDRNERIASNLNLEEIRSIQEVYPNAILGGSSALFLYGIKLPRHIGNQSKDIDLILPYFDLLTKPVEIDGETYTFKKVNGKKSGNDFDETFAMEGSDGSYLKIDYMIYPQCRYQLIEYNGFKYKVCPLFDIIEAKMRYAKGNGKSADKHRNDLAQMLGVNPILAK